MNSQKEPKEPRLRCRYVIVFLGFYVFFLLNVYRMNVSVSIVAMVNHSAVFQQTKVASESCPNLMSNVTSEVRLKNSGADGDFAWTPEIQGYILGSYFLGYVICQIPAGRLVERFGCKWFLFGSSLITAVCNFLIPAASWLSVPALIVLQTVRGLAQGFIQPAVSVLSANWFPKMERGFLLSIITSGAALGSFLASLFSGFLCASSGRWPSSFYTFGTMGLTASCLVAIFVHESPKEHPEISAAELHYIINNQESLLSKRRPKLPWRQILTSVPAYALMYGCFGQLWAASQFLIVHSTFLGTILHYAIEENGFLTAIPFLLQFTMAQLSCWLSSYMIQRNLTGVDFARKFWNFMSSFGFSVCLLGVYFAGCNRTLSIIFSILSTGFTGFGFAGCWIVSSDMAPTFAGSFNAICLTFGCLASVIFPLVVGYLTDKRQTIEQWNKIFFISIGVVMSSAIAFAIFGSAKVQSWNYAEEESTEEKDGDTKTRF